VVSKRFCLRLLELRAEGIRQFRIARRARLTPSALSAITSNAIPIRAGDPRVLRVARVIGLSPDECFEPDPLERDEDLLPFDDVDQGNLLQWDPRRRRAQ
jgi:transcriptional regulator with XRE-family HTH domain